MTDIRMTTRQPSSPVSPTPQSVQWLTIDPDMAGQRLDNFLLARLKGVPKSRIYRAVRGGEVRVNKARSSASYRLAAGDVVRVPPVRQSPAVAELWLPDHLRHNLEQGVLYEDETLLILNKPAGVAVHGGSGQQCAVIEGLRLLRPEARFLELAHRLDRDTSGCLLIAKKRSMLRLLHDAFRGDGMTKTYLALLTGAWSKQHALVNQPLLKRAGQEGARMVVVNAAGKPAQTRFQRLACSEQLTLVKAMPKTGRTHQIRVHAAWLGHPIAGDPRYGNFERNRALVQHGITGLQLHAWQLRFVHPKSGEPLSVSAPMPAFLDDFYQTYHA
ncbi:MAG: RluA family pseudouridine synthase [Methylococcales bacterium]|nr:RluA family pseudouridine synthase [Methylococcales bacterium]